MLKGCDVSSWQNPSDWNGDDFDFVIMKASEGVTITDSKAASHYKKAQSLGKLTGFYHYARPEYNTAAKEAQYFVSIVKPYIGKSILALDYEGKALAYGASWAKQWLDKVYELTGVKPVIYLQGSVVKDYKAILDADYGLWVAHWGVSSPRIAPWPFYTLWQYRGDPLDLDYFNGDKATWNKYAAVKGNEKEEPKKEESAEYKAFLALFKKARNETDPYYANIKDVPEYWRAEVEELVKAGAIRGNGADKVAKRRSQIEAMIPIIRYYGSK